MQMEKNCSDKFYQLSELNCTDNNISVAQNVMELFLATFGDRNVYNDGNVLRQRRVGTAFLFCYTILAIKCT